MTRLIRTHAPDILMVVALVTLVALVAFEPWGMR